MGIPAHCSNRWQKYERKITSAILRAQNLEFICWKLYMEIFWKLHAGNLLMRNLGGCRRLFDGGNYGPAQKLQAIDSLLGFLSMVATSRRWMPRSRPRSAWRGWEERAK